MKTYLKFKFVLSLVIIVSFLTNASAFQDADGAFVVVLDAGHGGHDSGNLGSGYKEKEIALKIVLEVGNTLAQEKDIKVIYTRRSDKFVTLRERAKIANDADADLFVSVHCNAHNSPANGTETFVLGLHANQRNFEIAKKENEVIFLESDYEKHYEGFDPKSPESLIGLTLIQEEYLDQSIRLARNIEDNFKQRHSRKSRGVKQAGFWVLHNTYMPSVLVETGFLTYKKEGAFLNSLAGQAKMAESISEAILKYKKQLDRNIGERIYSDTPKPIESNLNQGSNIFDDITFKVQIAASSKFLETEPYNFNGLNNVSRQKIGGLYKYYFGKTSDYNEIRRLESQAKAKGYRSAFVIATKNGQRIEISELLKTASN